jgi:hypothetical protein
MIIDLSGMSHLRKEQITILEMLHANNWERPMYYAITVHHDNFVRLDRYFQKTGMAYRITPIVGGSSYLDREEGSRPIDTEKMYDNVMHKFRWGGVDQPGVYLDETVMRMCKTYRGAIFGELAFALLEEGETGKAVAVLDKAMQVLPAENVPCDYSAYILAAAYIEAGEIEKGEDLLNDIADHYMRSIRWMYRLSPSLRATIINEYQRNLSIMQNVLGLGMRNNPDFGLSYRDEYSNYIMMYTRQPGNQ